MNRDDERFEAVLGRLDTLIKRGQPDTPPPPPPAISEANIPVLTEVYQATPLLIESVADTRTDIPEISPEEKLEQAVAAVLPLMVNVMEEVLAMKVQPAIEVALNRALADLLPQTEEILRQRLQTLLTQEEEDQTEI